MDQKEFKYRLDESTKKLIVFTRTMVSNSISENVEYLIEPNCRESSDHLNESELNKLKELNKLEGKLFSNDEVNNLLFDSGRVPLWINSEVHKSRSKKTIIKLICSRRFREDAELFHNADEFPPFHPLVPFPPGYREGDIFNLNRRDLMRKWAAFKWKWRKKS